MTNEKKFESYEDIARIEFGNITRIEFVLQKWGTEKSLNLLGNLPIKIEEIKIAGNQIEADLSIFSRFVNLKKLDLGFVSSDEERISEFNNKFFGSLQALKNLQKLEYLCIGNQQNITTGLEYLPAQKLTYFGCHGTVFEPELKPYDYDVYAWQLVNTDKTNLTEIKQKIAETEKQVLLEDQKTNKKDKKLTRLASKINLLSQKLETLSEEKPKTTSLLSTLTSALENTTAQSSTQPISKEGEPSQPEPSETREQLEKTQKQILERISAQAEEAKNKPIYSLPLNFASSQPREEFSPAKTCAKANCQVAATPNKDYCSFHEWETETFSQSLDEPKTETKTTSQTKTEPKELTQEELQAQRRKKQELAREKALAQAEEERKLREEQVRLEKERLATEKLQREQENREKKQPQKQPHLPDESKNESPDQNSDHNQESKQNNNQNPNQQPNGNNQPDNNGGNGNGPQPNHYSFFTKASQWGAATVGGCLGLATLATGIGYAAVQGAAVLWGVKSATGFATLIKAGWTASSITNQALTGLSLKSYFAAGATKIGSVLGSTAQGLGTLVVSSPWIWAPLTIAAVAGLGWLVHKKWDWITSKFTSSQQKVEQVAEKISEPVSQTLRTFTETPAEKSLRELEQQLAENNSRLENLENDLAQADNRSDGSETDRLREDLTEQLNEVKEQQKKTEEEIKKIPEEVRTASQAKYQALKNTVHSGVKYSLYFLIALVLLLIWKTTQRFFNWIFGWVRTTHQQTLTQIQARVEAMAKELEAKQIYQELQRIERENQQLTKPNPATTTSAKTETQNEPLVIKLEQPLIAVQTSTTEQRKRDRINAQRRARYHLKKTQDKQLKRRGKPKNNEP